MRTNRFLWIAAVGIAAGACALTLPSLARASGPRMEGVLQGVVRDPLEQGIEGVDVRLFVGGQQEARTRSGADGSYRLEFAFDPSADATALVWWISPRSDLVSDLAILRESARDRALGIWNPCLPRIGLDRSMVRPVQLVGPAERTKRLRESGCANAWTRDRGGRASER